MTPSLYFSHMSISWLGDKQENMKKRHNRYRSQLRRRSLPGMWVDAHDKSWKHSFQDYWMYKYQYTSYVYVYTTPWNHTHSGLEYDHKLKKQHNTQITCSLLKNSDVFGLIVVEQPVPWNDSSPVVPSITSSPPAPIPPHGDLLISCHH